MKGIASMADVLSIENQRPLLPNSTYEMIRIAASAACERAGAIVLPARTGPRATDDLEL